MTNLRVLRESDRAELVELAKQMSQQVGYEVWLPVLNDNCKVIVVEEDGQVIGAHIWRKVHDYMVIGTEPKVLLAGIRQESKVRALLKHWGVDEMIAFVRWPALKNDRWRARKQSAMQRIMARIGFRNISREFAAFEGSVDKG